MLDVADFAGGDASWGMVQGDEVEALRRLPDGSVDAFVSDPPYGIRLALKWNRRRPLGIAGDGPAEARRLWRAFVPEAARAARPDSAHVFFGTWKSPWIHQVLARH